MTVASAAGFYPPLLSLCVLAACASHSAVDGIDNRCRDVAIDEFEVGTSTQSEVLDRLGLPAQLISLDDRIVFYYLARMTSGRGRIFIVWNDVQETNRDDRAILFFDADGLRTDVAYSWEDIARWLRPDGGRTVRHLSSVAVRLRGPGAELRRSTGPRRHGRL